MIGSEIEFLYAKNQRFSAGFECYSKNIVCTLMNILSAITVLDIWFSVVIDVHSGEIICLRLETQGTLTNI